MDHSKIIKLLSLTQSDNDHEALSAIRNANKILLKNNFTWHQLLYHEKHEYKHTTNKKERTDESVYCDWWNSLSVREQLEIIDEIEYNLSLDDPYFAVVKSIISRFKRDGHISNKQVFVIYIRAKKLNLVD